MGLFSAIFGGGTTGASEQSQAAQIAANTATERFIRERTAEARGDVLSIFPQAQEFGQQAFQSAFDLISQGLPSQIGAFQQGNIGAQNVLAQTQPQFQNAILGLPTTPFSPVPISPDLGFLESFNQGSLQAIGNGGGSVPAPVIDRRPGVQPVGGPNVLNGPTPQIVLQEGDRRPTRNELITAGVGNTFPTDLVGTAFNLADVVNPDGTVRRSGQTILSDGQLERLANRGFL